MTPEQKEVYKLRLAWSGNAIQYVKSTGLKSTNRSLSEHLSLFKKLQLRGARSGYSDDWGSAAAIAARIEVVASTAREIKLGNCQEFSCLAFEYLRTHAPPQIGPLHWVSSQAPMATHALVLIGSIDTAQYPCQVQDSPSDTVCCDPWKEKTHSAIFWKSSQGLLNGSWGVAVLHSTMPEGRG